MAEAAAAITDSGMPVPTTIRSKVVVSSSIGRYEGNSVMALDGDGEKFQRVKEELSANRISVLGRRSYGDQR